MHPSLSKAVLAPDSGKNVVLDAYKVMCEGSLWTEVRVMTKKFTQIKTEYIEI